MCQWGDMTVVRLMESGKDIGVDSCIAQLVDTLNKSGIATIGSCCGHGYRPGFIELADGRELIIAPDYETARMWDKATQHIFPTIGGEWVGSEEYESRSDRCYKPGRGYHPRRVASAGDYT